MSYSIRLPNGTLVENIPDDLDPKEAKRKIIAAYPEFAPQTTIGGHVKEFFKGIPSGAIGLAETAGVGAAALLPEEYEQPVRKYIQETGAALQKPFAAEAGYEEAIPRKLGQAVGSTIPFVATGPFGAAGRAVAVGLGGASGAGEARLAAEEKGATGQERAIATALGTPVGLADIFIREFEIGKTLITRALASGGIEGATEAAQKVAQNLIAKGVYDPEQPIFAGSGEEGAYGAGAGALTRLLLDAVGGRRAHNVPPPKPNAPNAPVGLPATAKQGELFDDGMSGFGKLPLEPHRAAEETEGDRQNTLFQITEMRAQYDVLEREMDRLKTRYDQVRTQAGSEAEQQKILEQAQKIDLARRELEGKIKEAGSGLTEEDRARQQAPEGQMGLDFDMPEMPRQKTGEGVALDEQTAQPIVQTPEQIEFFRQQRVQSVQDRMNAGEMVTPAEMAFLKMDEREQRAQLEAQPTPQLFTGEPEGGTPQTFTLPDQITPSGFFQLQPSNIAQPKEETPVAPIEQETRPVTETDFKTMGIGRTNKKLRNLLLGKDLADPVQRAEVREVLTDFANDPSRSERIISGIENFLASPTFMEQGELDLRQPKKPRVTKTKEATDVLKPTESIDTTSEPSTTVADERGEVPAKGITTPDGNGVDNTGTIAGQPNAGEAAQPTALVEEETPPKGRVSSNEAITTLMANGYKRSEATQHVRSVEENGTVAVEDIDSVIGEQPQKQLGAAKPSYTPEQREMAELHASRVGGTVVWQDGDLALIRGYAWLSGQPVYIAAKGDTRTKNDIETHTGTVVTPQEKETLIKEKKKLEDADAKQHATKPFPSFANEQIVTSANTPKGVGGIIKGWADLLGIKANIYISTVDDVKKDKDKFTGPYHAIGSSALDARNLGEMRQLPNGDYYITFKQTTSKTAMLETLAHELGHVHQAEMYKNASPELKESITKEHDKWLLARQGETGRQLINSLRGKTTAKRTPVDQNLMAADLAPYWRSFKEWYADQVSRWATTNEKPVSIVEKFFARLGRAMREFFGNIKNKRYLPNETFVQYLEKVKESAVKDVTSIDTGLQAMKGDLTPEGQEAAALNERMKNIANEPAPDIDQTYRDRLTLMQDKAKGFPMKFRQAVVDKDAPVKEQIAAVFQNKVTNSLGEVSGTVLNEQAQEATGLADQLMRRGGIRLGKDGLLEAYDRTDPETGEPISLDQVFKIITEDLGKKLGSAEQAATLAHRAFIAQRANELIKHNAVLRQQADAAEAKGNKKAATKLRDQIIGVRASQEEIGAGLEAMRRFPELTQAFNTFTKYNEGIIDFLVDTGRLSPAQAQDWKDNVGYVPWTRVEEDTDKLEATNKLRTGNVHLTTLPSLDKEGSSKEIRSVLDNMVGNTIWAIRSGAKNRAAIKTLEQLPSAIELKSQDDVDRELKNNRPLVVFAYRDGERVAFKLQNQEDLAAFSNIIDVAGPMLGFFRGASTGLRSFVTHMPTFALSQLSQDTVRAMFLSGVKHPFSLPTKVLKNFYHAVTGGTTDLQALGVTGAYDGMPDVAMRRARERHGLQSRNIFKRAWDKLEDFSLAADMAVRAAIYEQTMKETGDRVLAFHRAKEYINFKTFGNGQTVRILRQIVPFMNAYIQGMDILYRTIQGKGLSMEDRKAALALFATTGMKVAALSMVYAMLVGDDDDYKGMEDYERDNNFIIPGTGLKLPVAPEIGFMFKVIPERIYQAIAREGTERPVDATTFMRGMRDAAINSYGGVNLMPQLVKPIVEVATNHSFFTDNPIVGINMAGKETYLQYNDHTSEIAKLLGHVGISPMKADYLIRGYLGTVGGVLLDTVDAVADPNRMNKPVNKLPLIKTFMYDDTGRGYKTEFYKFREDVDKVVNSVNTFQREGRVEELQDYLTDDKLNLYAMKGVVNRVEETLSKLRQYRNIIANDSDLSSAEKREQTDEILKQEKEILEAYNIPQLRKMAGM
jgi:hypothetical protein